MENIQEQVDDLKRRVTLLENLIVSMLTKNSSFASDLIEEAHNKSLTKIKKSRVLSSVTEKEREFKETRRRVVG